MNLTPHFTLAELCRTSTGLPNTPPPELLPNLTLLACALEEIRAIRGEPLFLVSGFRSAQVNAAVGGAPNSKHQLGLAGDIPREWWPYLWPNRVRIPLSSLLLLEEDHVHIEVSPTSRAAPRWLVEREGKIVPWQG